LEVGFPIRKFLDQSPFAAPQDLSQRTTSFIASQHQGIHQIPLRHLITLIINAHPRHARARSRQRPQMSTSRRPFTIRTHPQSIDHTKEVQSAQPLGQATLASFKDQLASTLSSRSPSRAGPKGQHRLRSSTTIIRYGPRQEKPPRPDDALRHTPFEPTTPT
jgi:hypothetical protein